MGSGGPEVAWTNPRSARHPDPPRRGVPAGQQVDGAPRKVATRNNAWQDGSVPNYGVVVRPEATWNNWQIWASSATELGNELRPRIVVVP